MAKITLHDGSLQEVNENEELYLSTLRHSCSHVLAQAIKHLYPDAKLAIGPSIKDGFYYDIDFAEPISEANLEGIENEMRKIIKQNLKIEYSALPREEAIKLMEERQEPYKVELINDLPEGELISFFTQGDFTDLCAGPHLQSTGEVGKAFKLQTLAGAYWRGSEKNKMLTRIYGTAFRTKEELEEHLRLIEEAKKRDHRKLGREQGLFLFSEFGPGFPFFLPNGMIVKNTLLDYWRKLHKERGYVEISTPVILSRTLWETSGHWDHYKENMYTTLIDDEDYAVKPMNCPGSIIIYQSEPRSYRDLPLRYAELGLVHRHEKSGELHGLFRVRCFTQDDAHTYITPEQIQSEVMAIAHLYDTIYKQFGFKYYVELSTRPENSMGTEEEWNHAENSLKEALVNLGMDYILNEGDGAFYGPKIDFHLYDALGRSWQCGTIQLDFQLPQRFELEYMGADGEKHQPIMIHRTAFGSVERFLGILIEHFAGALPTWLAPTQVKILAVSDKFLDYAEEVKKQIEDAGIRVEIDMHSEKLGWKIRQAQKEKVPYMLIVGEKDQADKTVSVRSRANGDEGPAQLDEFIARVNEEIRTKAM